MNALATITERRGASLQVFITTGIPRGAERGTPPQLLMHVQDLDGGPGRLLTLDDPAAVDLATDPGVAELVTKANAGELFVEDTTPVVPASAMATAQAAAQGQISALEGQVSQLADLVRQLMTKNAAPAPETAPAAPEAAPAAPTAAEAPQAPAPAAPAAPIVAPAAPTPPTA